ncbi:MAG: ABC transporter permease [Cytophagales bacterium]|nr:ABC transporter permease [Bernardetiaceae bacterium]MDW8205556.1 ABC transporter permease [Cytophagales bacterium]
MKQQTDSEEHWTEIIRPETPWWDLKLKELYRYRDLVRIFVWRDFVAAYKQTLLGPLWHFINPFASTIINTIVFGAIAQIPMEGIPPFLFQFTSTMIWSYFVRCFGAAQNTFLSNSHIFSKVYFPRLAVPVSGAISALLQFGILFIFYLLCIGWYNWRGEAVGVDWRMLPFFPVTMLGLALSGMGLGAIVAALTTKYRDLNLFVGYGLSLLMYSSAVVYPLSALPDYIKQYAWLNPLIALMELGRSGLLGTGVPAIESVLLSVVISVLIFLIGLIMFNRAERTFIDTV